MIKIAKRGKVRKRKITKKALIIAIILCIIVIIILFINTIKELGRINESGKVEDKAELVSTKEKTEKEIYEKYEIEEKTKIYNEEGIIQIELSFSKELYEEDNNSNKEYFEAIIDELVDVYKKDFILLDKEKNIKIKVIATSENNSKYSINEIENYFEETEKNNEKIRNYKEIKEIEEKIENRELKKFDSNNGSLKASGVKIEEYGKDYVGYNGYKVLTNDIYIDTIILENTYTEEILDGIKVGTEKEKIVEKLGNATFSDKDFIGYKILDSYMFFYDDEIAIYPNTNFDNVKIENNILEYMNSEEKIEREKFALKFLVYNMDFVTQIDEENNLVLTSVNRGIQVKISENLEFDITIYNNYTMTETTKKCIREGIIKTEFEKDLIFEKEKERK